MASPPPYPPSPDHVPPELTAVSGDYRLRVSLMLVIVIVFFLLYLALLGFALYLIIWGITSPVPARGAVGRVLAKILLTLLGALLLFFLVRGFFRGGGRSRSALVRVTPEDQPRLFAFIGELCEQTGAPMPGKVYVSFEVTASASLNPSLLSLFWPT